MSDYQPTTNQSDPKAATHKKNRQAIKVAISVVTALFLILIIFNYSINKIAQTTVSEDPRNSNVVFTIMYKHFIPGKDLVFNIRDIGMESAPVDVFRVLLHTAEALQHKDFNTITLAYKGDDRFLIQGNYFQEIGESYRYENPAYTMRTFCEHLYNIDGTRAFSTWTGGILGVLNAQLEDFNEFHHQWYLDDLL